jgi:hypothetical protein
LQRQKVEAAKHTTRVFIEMRRMAKFSLQDPGLTEKTKKQGQEMQTALAELMAVQSDQDEPYLQGRSLFPFREGAQYIAGEHRFTGGENEDWTTWRRDFEILADFHDWGPGRRRGELIEAMQGWASRAVAGLAENHPSHGFIYKPDLLLDAYAAQLDIGSAPSWLPLQGVTQTVVSWGHQIRYLSQSIQGTGRTRGESEMVFQFIRGLRAEVKGAVVNKIKSEYPTCHGERMADVLKIAKKVEDTLGPCNSVEQIQAAIRAVEEEEATEMMEESFESDFAKRVRIGGLEWGSDHRQAAYNWSFDYRRVHGKYTTNKRKPFDPIFWKNVCANTVPRINGQVDIPLLRHTDHHPSPPVRYNTLPGGQRSESCSEPGANVGGIPQPMEEDPGIDVASRPNTPEAGN